MPNRCCGCCQFWTPRWSQDRAAAAVGLCEVGRRPGNLFAFDVVAGCPSFTDAKDQAEAAMQSSLAAAMQSQCGGAP